MNKRVFLIPPLIAAIVLSVLFLRSRQSPYITAPVQRGAVVQEVLASGNTAAPKTIDLQFQTSGKVLSRAVEVGDVVRAGQRLAELDTSVLSAQLQQSLAALQAQQAQLQNLKEGTRPEQIAVAQAQVESDTAALSQADQGLLDAIKSAYTVSDAAVLNSVDPFFNNPSFNPRLNFSLNDSQLQALLEGERLSAATTLSKWAQEIDGLRSTDDLAGPEARARTSLDLVATLLSDSNAALNKAISSQQVSAAQITTWLSGVAASRTSVNAAISALTAASTARRNAASLLTKDGKNLELLQAGSTSATIATQEAQVRAAEANADTIRAQLAQARISAPVSGTITKTNVEVGETVTPTTLVISMIPDSKLQIDVNLSEDAVAFAKVGNPARITLDAFGSAQQWHGTVVKIDPAQTLQGGAVYYKTTVSFDQSDERVRPGMTANVWIETGSSTSALYVPASALASEGTSTYVQLMENNTTVKQQVVTGLKSQDGKVEILSGVNEGQEVVIGTK